MTDRFSGVSVHPMSVIEDGAEIGSGSRIGPFCHLGPKAKLGGNCELKSHVVVAGDTTIGAGTRIFPHASIGHEPQDLKYAGEDVTLTIGDNCLIREGVTINPGTGTGISHTTIGNNCVFLANSHVAHDCQLGNGVIFSNNVMLAGHCTVGDHVIIGGGAGVHQFCRIGNNAFVGGLAGVENDVIPFGIALGNRAYLGGLNVIGMKRAGLERTSIHAARNMFKHVFGGDSNVSEALDTLSKDILDDPVVAKIITFIREGGDRALCTPVRGN